MEEKLPKSFSVPNRQKRQKVVIGGSDSFDIYQSTVTEEIIVALCGPIGSPFEEVTKSIIEGLSDFGYDFVHIKISQIIEMMSKGGIPKECGYARKEALIEKGNEFRKAYNNSVLVEKFISNRAAERDALMEENDSQLLKGEKKCFIIDSLKNKEEYELLKSVYGKLFYMIGVFSDRESRIKNLESDGVSPEEAVRLVARDYDEKLPHGQQVQGLFPLSDFFVCKDYHLNNDIKEKITRFLTIVTEASIVTPTMQEHAMYSANSAGLNSACLSRQVGACVTDSDCNILSVGWNDVPKSGGGVYSIEDGARDRRCYKNGEVCYNQVEKNKIVDEIVAKVVELGLIDIDDTVLKVSLQGSLRNGRLGQILEFSRAVHAEMHALIRAASKTGQRMLGGSIFITTYPCHNCARHLIVAGIKKIYFIEPYPKSLATELHGDAITEGEDSSKVQLVPFEGVSPARYADMFERKGKKWKDSDSGKMFNAGKELLVHKSQISLESIYNLETSIAKRFQTKVKEISSSS